MPIKSATIDRILVGIDFSGPSEIAFTQALNLSRTTGSTLFLVHAVCEDELPARGVRSRESHAEAVRDHRDSSNARLEAMCRRGRELGVRSYHRVVEAGPDESLPQLADALDADLVVVGTHGRTGLRELLLGSVAERVVRGSRKSVLVARPRASARGGFNHIFVPTDFSPSADKALAAAVDVVSAGGVIEVVHFWHVPLAAASHWVPGKTAAHQRRLLRGEIDALGNELTARFSDRHPKISFEDEEKPATTGIVERIESGVYDLIVIGSHGRRGFRRWVAGSLAESTLRYAPCSVMVIHQGAS